MLLPNGSKSNGSRGQDTILTSQYVLANKSLVVTSFVHSHIGQFQFQRLGQADREGGDHPNNVDGHSVGTLSIWD